MYNPTSVTLAVDNTGVPAPPLLRYPPNTCDPRPAVVASGVANFSPLRAL